jgi:hypothetical protein
MNGPEIIGGEDIAKILTRVLGMLIYSLPSIFLIKKFKNKKIRQTH